MEFSMFLALLLVLLVLLIVVVLVIEIVLLVVMYWLYKRNLGKGIVGKHPLSKKERSTK